MFPFTVLVAHNGEWKYRLNSPLVKKNDARWQMISRPRRPGRLPRASHGLSGAPTGPFPHPGRCRVPLTACQARPPARSRTPAAAACLSRPVRRAHRPVPAPRPLPPCLSGHAGICHGGILGRVTRRSKNSTRYISNLFEYYNMAVISKDERDHLYNKNSAVYSEIRSDDCVLPKRYRTYQRKEDDIGYRLENMILELDQVLKIN